MMSHQHVLLLSAAQFAAHKHRKQFRKDADHTPYIQHPLAVARSSRKRSACASRGSLPR